MTNSKKVLLSSVCKPFGVKYGDGFGVTAEGTHQIMWAQGVFRYRATTTQWGIDFIAANLKTPTVTLHYPTMKQFIAEIKKGYDYIGIAFISATFHKMLPMIDAIKKYAPQAEIVLGGYGTVIRDDLTKYADHVCKGEGVSFMRKLLDEPQDSPIVQPDVTQKSTLFSIPLPSETAYIFAGLGCPNGCDFCATSHYFNQKHIKFLPNGQSILSAIHDTRRKHPHIDKFWINDEDFLLNYERGHGFLEAIRASDLPPLSISCFGSVKGLSQYSAADLVEMGIDWVWVGYEGKRSGYKKLVGKTHAELFEDFHNHGISVLASMIIGFDYQTPEIIQEEFEELLSLRPSMCQFLIYGPPFGTPLYERLEKEGRLDDEVMSDNRKHDGFTLGFHHPSIGRKEMSAIQQRLYRQEFERLGPSVFRVVENMIMGYKNLKNHERPRVRDKARQIAIDAHATLPLISTSRKWVNAQTAVWLSNLQTRIELETGPMTRKEKLISYMAPAMIRYTDFKLRHDINQQAEFTKKEFRMSVKKKAIAKEISSEECIQTT